jgi:DnaJ family protein A protein 5
MHGTVSDEIDHLLTEDLWHNVSRLYDDHNHGPIPNLRIQCLGLGKPFSDRSAQIQLALLLELSARLQDGIRIEAYDPVSDEGDRKVQDRLGISLFEHNLASRFRIH